MHTSDKVKNRPSSLIGLLDGVYDVELDACINLALPLGQNSRRPLDRYDDGRE